MIDEILDHLVGEKIDYREYKELAEKMDNEDLKGMFMKMSEDEHEHYKMLKEFIEQKVVE